MSDSFAHYLRELFTGLGPVSLRKLFGGQGLYHDGIMIGLVAGEDLFLKTDANTVSLFEAAGGRPFVYQGNGKSVEMSYWSPPAEAMESADDMLPWARLAYAAAIRNHANKQSGHKSKKSGKSNPSKKSGISVRPSFPGG